MDEEKKIEKNEEVSSEDIIVRKKIKLLKYGCYIVLLIVSIIVGSSFKPANFELGDFGSIIPLLLETIALMGVKWLPIFSVSGLLVTKFEEKLGDFSNAYLTIVIIVSVISFGLLLMI